MMPDLWSPCIIRNIPSFANLIAYACTQTTAIIMCIEYILSVLFEHPTLQALRSRQDEQRVT